MPFPLLPVVGVIFSGLGLALALRKPKIPPALAQAAVNAPLPPAVQAAQQVAVLADNPAMSEAEAAGAVAAAEAMAAENTKQFVKDQGLQERRTPIAEQTRENPRPIVSQALPVVVPNHGLVEFPDVPGMTEDPEEDNLLASLNPFSDD